jgi:glycerophosphoryl diester phosphodiesterase
VLTNERLSDYNKDVAFISNLIRRKKCLRAVDESMAWLRDHPIAHRGFHDGSIPENSIPAFEAAISKGLCIELDVRRSSDGKLIVFHDDNLSRMTGHNAFVHKTPYSVIRSLKLAGSEQRIPLLEEVLALVEGKAPLLVEVKKHDKAGEADVVRILREYKEKFNAKVAIQSFNPLVVKNIKKLSPEFFCGLLSSNFKGRKIFRLYKAAIKNARLFFIAKPDFISFEINSFPNKRISKFRKSGLLVLGWTVMTPEEVEKAKGLCDNIILEKTRFPNILEMI